jgi:hypothetical protein
MKTFHGPSQCHNSNEFNALASDNKSNLRREMCMQQRRLARLYGSSLNVKCAKREKNKHNLHETRIKEHCGESPLSHRRGAVIILSNNKKKKEVVAKQTNCRPWFVGYQNSSTVSCSTPALVKRYVSILLLEYILV